MKRCLLALGSNLGNPLRAIERATRQLSSIPGVAMPAVSQPHRTVPVGGEMGQPPYLNGAAVLETNLSPQELLTQLQSIERGLGRERRARWAARTLDLDLLLYADTVIREPHLIIPHPRMSFRPFVLAPAVEIAADMSHPLLGKNLSQLLRQLTEGENAVTLCHGDPTAYDQAQAWIEEIRPGTAVEKRHGVLSAQRPTSNRLTISFTQPGKLPFAGPTLWLPPKQPLDQRKQELTAAMQCAWPVLG